MKGGIGIPMTYHGTMNIRYASGDKCPSCNSSDNPKNGILRIIQGKYGKFLGCSLYPNCKYTTTRIK